MAKKPKTTGNKTGPKAAKRKTAKLDVDGDLLKIMTAGPPTESYTLQQLQASLKARFKKEYPAAAVKKALESLDRKKIVERRYLLGVENAVLQVMAEKKATSPHTHEQILSDLKDERFHPKDVEQALESLANDGKIERRYSVKSAGRRIAPTRRGFTDDSTCDTAKMTALSTWVGLGTSQNPSTLHCPSPNAIQKMVSESPS